MDEKPDPHEAACLHGLWPLVPAPDTAVGVRFADLGADAPGDCLTSVEGLPGHELVLRTFGNAALRRAWAAAATEFGGNAVALVMGPPLPNRPLCFALVARLDRDRPQGAATLDAAIPLRRDQEQAAVGHLRDIFAEARHVRSDAMGRHASDRRRSAWHEAWAAEIAVIRAVPALLHIENAVPEGDHLPLTLAGHRLAGRLRRDGANLRAEIHADLPDRVGPELRERFARRAEALGWSALPKGGATRSLDRFDAATAAGLAADAVALQAEAARITMAEAARTTLMALHVDPESLRVLRRMGQGLPVASQRYRDPAAQLAPRTGKAATVAASRVERLFLAGAIAPVWWREPTGRRESPLPVTPLDWAEQILWGLTQTGRAFVAGDIEAAAETQIADAATALAWLRGKPQPHGRIPQPHAGLADAVARLPKPERALAGAIGESLARERLSRWFPGGADRLALVGAALAAGLLESDGKTISPVDEPAAPSP